MEVEALTHRTDGKPQSKIVIDHENYFIEYVTRAINTNAEAHNHWYDYIHVLDGEGSITYGGTQDGGTDSGMGEIRGGKLVGGKFQILKPGDRLVLVADRALETSRLRREVKELKALTPVPINMVGHSPSINQLRQSVEKIARM